MFLPKLGITLGDPAGIGPEIVGKALTDKNLYKICSPVVICDPRLIPNYKTLKNYRCKFVNIPSTYREDILPGKFSVTTGKMSYEYIIKAIQLAKQKKIDGIITAPISKAALNLAGIYYSGHTELLAEQTNTKDFAMMMAADKMRVVMVTRHLSLNDISKHISIEKIVKTTELADNFLKQKFRIKSPRIGVCALNPHAGENGMLGKEEANVIIPAVNTLKERDINLIGPISADAAWLKMKKGEFDLLVSMYHDQAMIGLKCLCASKIVNITIGLPFIRTSPGHGTGFDIAGKNIADPVPMKESIKLAAKLI